MRRFTPLRIGFLGVLTSFALLLGMLAFPSMASAHTASVQTPASAHSTSWGGCGFECGGGFDRFGGCGDFGFNDGGFDCGGGFGFDNGGFGFNDCGFGFND